MHTTAPKVHLISRPQLDWPSIFAYLDSVGGTKWGERVSQAQSDDTLDLPDAEVLVEFMGRLCYKAWAPGLNPNVTKVRENSAEYIQNIVAQEHGSVFEHPQFSFVFEDVSRVFTHELVRHRVGVGISQESLRYVRLVDIGMWIPPVIQSGPVMANGQTVEQGFISVVEAIEDYQRNAAEAFGLDDKGVPFHVKKEVTSALRRVANMGLATHMGWSSNIRTLRFVIMKRTEAGAEEEIRMVFNAVGEIMKTEAPAAFADFNLEDVPRSDIPAWVPEHQKI